MECKEEEKKNKIIENKISDELRGGDWVDDMSRLISLAAPPSQLPHRIQHTFLII